MKPDDRSTAEERAVRAAYVAAIAATDEAPGAHVRAAVLAAAARAVGAGPVGGTPGRWSGRRRVPRSVAALLAVSVLTGLVASHAVRDAPERVVAPPRIAMADPVAPAPPVIVATTAAEHAAERPAMPARPAPRRDAGSGPRPDRSERAPRAASRDAAGDPRVDVAAVPAASAPAPMAEPTARSKATAAVASPQRMTSLAATGPAIAPHGRVGIEAVTPEAWVARIVALRDAGNDDAADQEVAALGRRYPDFRIPERALTPSGATPR